ncbi:hypothetical protein PR048_029192 [Dryococelus australis]|uniref:Uncharacterized protein n=1 Tax=Dryococelus australis TaxID=614101 RepID=A0ABQ9GFG8_9NEOP|nr:hypothetical protein PR048_029192 [Dryococelus australis]
MDPRGNPTSRVKKRGSDTDSSVNLPIADFAKENTLVRKFYTSTEKVALLIPQWILTTAIHARLQSGASSDDSPALLTTAADPLLSIFSRAFATTPRPKGCVHLPPAFLANRHFSSHSRQVHQVIKSHASAAVYIGETGWPLSTCIKEHKKDTRHGEIQI